MFLFFSFFFFEGGEGWGWEGGGYICLSCFGLAHKKSGICEHGKNHMLSTASVRSFPNIAFETVPMFV